MEETKQVNTEVASLKDHSVQTRIRTLYLEGIPLKDILPMVNVPKGTYDAAYYLNTHGLRDFMLDTKKEYMLQETEKITKKILAFDTDEISDKRLAIQQKEAEFLRETLGKDIFSKRIETIGMNVIKSEPLDADQQEKLDRILGSKNKTIVDVSFRESENDLNISDIPSKE